MTEPRPRGTYYTYMVQCKYGTYYTGYTNDIKKRVTAHNNGTGAKYLRGKGPVKLVYKKKYSTALKAQAQERLIKSLPRKEKESLIKKRSFASLPGPRSKPRSGGAGRMTKSSQ